MKAVPIYKREKLTGKVIRVRWRFEQYNPEKQRNEPVPVAQIPTYIRESTDLSVVEAYCKSVAARTDALRHRLAERKEWKERYHDFEKLLGKFRDFQKERAPNSYEGDCFYLENYAFAFFLSESSLNNLNEWPRLFDDFRTWLRTVKPLKYKKTTLALNTQIKIIKSLNRFLHFCSSKGWIDQLPKCPTYSRAETITVSADDIFSADETKLIRTQLEKICLDSADFFTLLLNTGLRENEAFGLSIDSIFEGFIEGPRASKIHSALDKQQLGNYLGYVLLESQPACKRIRIDKPLTDRFGKSWPSHSVPRKPLKHRTQIGPKCFRYIPIFDAQTWNLLVDRVNGAEGQFESRSYGNERQNYLLFNGLTASKFYADLTKALQALNLPHRSPHKLRHTYLTWLYDKINEDMFLAGQIAGHRDQRDVERYGHVVELIGREMKQKQQRRKRLKKV